ncbi:hypothetical protein PT2222_90220 [Paraburkholderia tropica]
MSAVIRVVCVEYAGLKHDHSSRAAGAWRRGKTLMRQALTSEAKAARRGSDAAPAVHFETRAGDERGFVGGQIEAGVGHVLRRGEAPERDRRDEARAVLGRVGHAHEFGGEARIADHGIHTVHADAVGAEFGGERLARDDHRALAAVVPDEPGARPDARRRGDVDERAAAALAKMRHERAHAPVEAFHVDGENAVEFRFADLHHGLVAMRGARVIDDDLHAAEAADGGVAQRVPVGFARDVALHGDRLAARVRDLTRDALCGLGVQIVDDDMGAFARIGFGDAFAESRTGARHDGRLACESHAVSEFFISDEKTVWRQPCLSAMVFSTVKP